MIQNSDTDVAAPGPDELSFYRGEGTDTKLLFLIRLAPD
jgi:hypothetical protein